jgi:hypothetical protein
MIVAEQLATLVTVVFVFSVAPALLLIGIILSAIFRTKKSQ